MLIEASEAVMHERELKVGFSRSIHKDICVYMPNNRIRQSMYFYGFIMISLDNCLPFKDHFFLFIHSETNAINYLKEVYMLSEDFPNNIIECIGSPVYDKVAYRLTYDMLTRHYVDSITIKGKTRNQGIRVYISSTHSYQILAICQAFITDVLKQKTYYLFKNCPRYGRYVILQSNTSIRIQKIKLKGKNLDRWKKYYLGCYRIPTSFPPTPFSYSVDSCVVECRLQKAPVAALQQDKCFCVKKVSILGYTVPSKYCNSSCLNDILPCGSDDYVSIYTTLSDAMDVKKLGCYEAIRIEHNRMEFEYNKCMTLCWATLYKYAAFRDNFLGRCYCMDYTNGKKTDETKCSLHSHYNPNKTYQLVYSLRGKSRHKVLEVPTKDNCSLQNDLLACSTEACSEEAFETSCETKMCERDCLEKACETFQFGPLKLAECLCPNKHNTMSDCESTVSQLRKINLPIYFFIIYGVGFIIMMALLTKLLLSIKSGTVVYRGSIQFGDVKSLEEI